MDHPRMPPDHSTSDAWVLHAVALAAGEGSTTLPHIVATGDFVNHAVFNPDELSDCLGRLLSAGLVERNESGFAPSQAVRQRLAKGGLTAQREKARRLVEQQGVAQVEGTTEGPTEAECQASIAEYVALFSSRPGRPV